MQAYCRSRGLPGTVQSRGLRFIDSRHRAQQIIEARSLLAEMPTTLREDILLEGKTRSPKPLKRYNPKAL